jgi:Flp pilus assembly pilin Flp
MTKFTAFPRDEAGVSATEYVLLLAIVGAGIIAGITFLGSAIGSAMNRAGASLNTLTFTAS